jgi:hypothetical protein
MALIRRSKNFAHVARNPGQAEQTALLVQQFFNLRSAKFFLPFEKREHTRIKIAGTGPHD